MKTTKRTTKQTTRRTSRRTAAVSRTHRGRQTLIQTETRHHWQTEQRWAEPRVQGALPLCQPCSPPTTRGSPCIASSISHSPTLCCCAGDLYRRRDPAPIWKSVQFHPQRSSHLTARATDSMPKTASHWFGDVMNISALVSILTCSFSGLRLEF